MSHTLPRCRCLRISRTHEAQRPQGRICQLTLLWGGRLEHIQKHDDGYNIEWPSTAGSAPVCHLCRRASLSFCSSCQQAESAPCVAGVGLDGSPTIAPDASWPSCLLPSCCGQVLIEGSSLSDERERRTHSVRLLCLQSNGNGGQVRGTMPSVLAPGRAGARIATPVRRLRRSTLGVT